MEPIPKGTRRAARTVSLVALTFLAAACGGSQGGTDPACAAPASSTEAAAEPSPCDDGGGFGY